MIIKIPTAIMQNKEKRYVADRRRHSLGTLTYSGLSGRGRRVQARRSEGDYYLDYCSPRLFFMSFTLLLLSCLDAFFTMRLMERGAYEANALMAYFMSVNIGVFFAAKIGLTVLGAVMLATHANFTIFRLISGKQLLGMMIGIYTLLICYEVILLGR